MKLFIFSLVFTLFSFHSAFACRCEEPNSVAQEFQQSEVVSLARVISTTKVELCETMSPEELIEFEEKLDEWGRKLLSSYTILKVEVQVVRSYKGAEVGDILTVYTAADPKACGYWDFEKDRSFLIYADDESYLYQMASPSYKANSGLERKGTFWTSSCKRTTSNFVGETRDLEGMSIASNR